MRYDGTACVARDGRPLYTSSPSGWCPPGPCDLPAEPHPAGWVSTDGYHARLRGPDDYARLERLRAHLRGNLDVRKLVEARYSGGRVSVGARVVHVRADAATIAHLDDLARAVIFERAYIPEDAWWVRAAGVRWGAADTIYPAPDTGGTRVASSPTIEIMRGDGPPMRLWCEVSRRFGCHLRPLPDEDGWWIADYGRRDTYAAHMVCGIATADRPLQVAIPSTRTVRVIGVEGESTELAPGGHARTAEQWEAVP